jgi:KUP system potassium uptake protein
MIDLTFFSASLLKVLQGGWFPLALGIVIFMLMRTWRQGREALGRELSRSTLPLAEFLPLLLQDQPQRIPGTAVFLTANADITPHALMHNLNHNKVLHERVVFLTIEFADVPWIRADERVNCEPLSPGFFRLTARYGFMEQPNVVEVMQFAAAKDCVFDPMQTSYFMSRQKIVPVERGASGMASWRDRLFALMARNASDITDYLNIPPNRVVELGTRIEF